MDVIRHDEDLSLRDGVLKERFGETQSFVYEPQVRQLSGRYTYLIDLGFGRSFDRTPQLESNDAAIDWLVSRGLTGQVMRYSKTANASRHWLTAGVAAEVYMNTDAVDADTETPILGELCEGGFNIVTPYRGPFSKEMAQQLADDLAGDHFGPVVVVKHGDGYNVAYHRN